MIQISGNTPLCKSRTRMMRAGHSLPYDESGSSGELHSQEVELKYDDANILLQEHAGFTPSEYIFEEGQLFRPLGFQFLKDLGFTKPAWLPKFSEVDTTFMPTLHRQTKPSPRRSTDEAGDRPSPQTFYRSIASVYVAGFVLLIILWGWKRQTVSGVASVPVQVRRRAAYGEATAHLLIRPAGTASLRTHQDGPSPRQLCALRRASQRAWAAHPAKPAAALTGGRRRQVHTTHRFQPSLGGVRPSGLLNAHAYQELSEGRSCPSSFTGSVRRACELP